MLIGNDATCKIASIEAVPIKMFDSMIRMLTNFDMFPT